MQADAEEVFVFLPVLASKMKLTLFPHIAEAGVGAVGELDGDATWVSPITVSDEKGATVNSRRLPGETA